MPDLRELASGLAVISAVAATPALLMLILVFTDGAAPAGTEGFQYGVTTLFAVAVGMFAAPIAFLIWATLHRTRPWVTAAFIAPATAIAVLLSLRVVLGNCLDQTSAC